MVISTIILSLALISQPPHKTLEKKHKKAPQKHIVHREREKERNFSIGIDLGAIFPAGKIGFGTGFNFGYVLHFKKFNLQTGLFTGFYNTSDSGSITYEKLGGTYSYTTKLYSVPFIIDCSMIIHLDSKFFSFFGLGVGSAWVRSKEEFLYSNSETKFVPAFQLYAGVEYSVGPGSVYFSPRYSYSKVDFLTSGSLNSIGLGVFVGYRFYF